MQDIIELKTDDELLKELAKRQHSKLKPYLAVHTRDDGNVGMYVVGNPAVITELMADAVLHMQEIVPNFDHLLKLAIQLKKGFMK